jgi:ribose-phosphate pyrophosphokinase
MTKIIAGSNTERLADEIATLTGIRKSVKVVKRFPDGELYVKLDGGRLSGEKVFILQSLYPRQDECLMELFLTIDAVKRNGGRPCVIIPYFAYARQDKVFLEGEAFSLEAIGKMLKALGTEGIVTVDAHFRRKEGEFSFFGIPAVNLSAAKLLFEHAKEVSLGIPFLVAGPDAGSSEFLSSFRDALFIEKSKLFREGRDVREYEVVVKVPEGLSGKKVLLLDDIISSGSTMIGAAGALKAKKCSVMVGCVHGLFIGGSLGKIRKIADYVFCTDTVESESSKVSVGKLIAKEIERM